MAISFLEASGLIRRGLEDDVLKLIQEFESTDIINSIHLLTVFMEQRFSCGGVMGGHLGDFYAGWIFSLFTDYVATLSDKKMPMNTIVSKALTLIQTGESPDIPGDWDEGRGSIGPLEWEALDNAIASSPIYDSATTQQFSPRNLEIAQAILDRITTINDAGRYQVTSRNDQDHDLITIKDTASQSSFTVMPDRGFTLTSFIVGGKEAFNYQKDLESQGGMFWMFPFANRLENGQFEWSGKGRDIKDIPGVTLVGDTQNPIHGLVRHKSWNIEDIGIDEEGLYFKASIATADFPEIANNFGRSALTVIYRLNGNQMIFDVAVENKDSIPVIADVGGHEFGRVTHGETTLQLKANKVYASDKENIPSGELSKATGILDFSDAKTTQGDTLDHVFTEIQTNEQGAWEAVITDHANNRKRTILVDGEMFPVATVWDGNQEFPNNLSVEFQTAETNGVNNPDAITNFKLLQVGEVRSGRVVMKVEDAAILSVEGFHFQPELDFKQGITLSNENIESIKARVTRGIDDVLRILQDAKDRGIELTITGHLRGVDGPGSSLDLPEFQDKLTDEHTRGFNNLPSTPTIASDFTATVKFELADDPNQIVYVAPDYGITEGNPYIFNGEVPLVNGRTPKGQLDGVGFIMTNIFGLKGIKITMDSISPMALAGGMESSNVFNTALIAAASMFTGANLSVAEIFSLAVKLENDEFGGLTGGQGHLSTLLGGAYRHIWLSGIKDSEGNLVNPYSAVSIPLFTAVRS